MQNSMCCKLMAHHWMAAQMIGVDSSSITAWLRRSCCLYFKSIHFPYRLSNTGSWRSQFFFLLLLFHSTVYGSIRKCPAFSWSVGKWEVSDLWVGQIHFIQFAIWKSDFSKPNSVRSLQCGDAILQSKNKNSFILVCRFKGFMLFSVLLRVNYHMTYTHF